MSHVDLGVRIVMAANRFANGAVVLGVRHYDPIMHKALKAQPDLLGHDCEQGFVDNKGNFHSREAAWIIAEKQNQILRRVGGDGERLYSENLY